MDFPAFPVPLRRLIARLPAYPPAAMAALMVNIWFGAMLNARNLPAARGRIIAIHIRDIGLRLAFAMEDEGLVARGSVSADATISAEARDFLALAMREQDPDTLFFNRRLTMEGDTELALLVKNTLDGIDFRALGLPPLSRVLTAAALQLRSLL